MHGTDISEITQTSASLIGSTLFVPAALWMLLMPLAHRLGVAFVPSGTNRRLLWLLQHQWHSWLVPFSMLDLASLERMWPGGHTEAMKWGVRGGDGGEQQLGFFRGHFAVKLDKKSKPSNKNTLSTSHIHNGYPVGVKLKAHHAALECIKYLLIRNKCKNGVSYIQMYYIISHAPSFLTGDPLKLCLKCPALARVTETNELSHPTGRFVSLRLWKISL